MAKPSTFAAAAPSSRCEAGAGFRPSPCEVPSCRATGRSCFLEWGPRRFPRTLCHDHRIELQRLVRDQGKDWGRSRKKEGWNARFYYASKRGFRAY